MSHQCLPSVQISKSKLNSGGGWSYIYERLKEHDTTMIDGYTGDIDTLLVFAGLFSAVLTAFLVDTYPHLQPDNTQLSAQVLLDISQQLFNLSRNEIANPSTVSVTEFHAPTSLVVINSFWFVSLVVSLASALLGILVKQWLREYILWTTVTPIHSAINLRQYRYNQLQRWKVPEIVTGLPTVLQAAVVLFFTGLIALLWPINERVTVVTTI
ncbi:hypothetical protein PUNSTDRAFT_63606, partial [Punctularia strigosozonata HHB-11173 SS5]|uniref:uncharacterized protein n=1 Tax=Punctularia strigosozonata (strain HHB-11173) TaxID=741275 RepID=UPI00044174A7